MLHFFRILSRHVRDMDVLIIRLPQVPDHLSGAVVGGIAIVEVKREHFVHYFKLVLGQY